MGSTVSTAKMASAFETEDGPFYVLFEETYEKNCYPRTPRWGCVGFGQIQHVMKWIFHSAASCEGGMLQGAGGRYITPEGYIASWLKELACPVYHHDHDVELETSSSYRASIPQEKLQTALATLAESGRPDIAEKIDAGEAVSLSIHEDGTFLCELYETLSLAPWRLIEPHLVPLDKDRRAELGYRPAKTKGFDMTMPSFRKISSTDHSMLKQMPDKRWICDGWCSGYMNDYVRGLWNAELNEPGSYRARIKAYRAAMKDAPLIPSAGVEIRVDTSVEVDKYSTDVVNRVLDVMEHRREGTVVRIPVPVAKPLDYHATILPVECTSWFIPSGDEMVQASLFNA
tara:strand:- start:11413 stop:12441 length:1029 start_codon:yes stop_codon:yes gene_type:complete